PSASALVGGPVVNVTDAVVGSSAELAARLWDVTPGGGQSVISRTVYRIEVGTAGTATLQLSLELWPNAWQLQCGHLLRLELTQDDAPTWRPDNVASTMTLSNLSLSLPVVAGSSC
ncbi:MAG TPA: CocE/NonD family hydrolase C-terminal non-catalytic domain-containing protein, partial [Mycobacteriales bacterium]|nr:CocE/NonD family hydrolase C-terminal non-catalytic domain-containing protein [Mycobacteriales bacterium]